MRPTTFILGTHHPDWLGRTGVPLFVSNRTLMLRKAMPRARGWWALDSGGFSEINMHGEWTTTPAEYIARVKHYQREVGKLAWCAPQDWMCEPQMIQKTGLSVPEHQRRTVRSFLTLRDAGLPVIPVLQGWAHGDYYDCIEMYARAGVDLRRENLVGLGSVCRRQNSTSGALLVDQLSREGLTLHGFGFKTTGLFAGLDLAQMGHPKGIEVTLASSDSMAWSFHARLHPPLPGHEGMHQHCNNCMDYALHWRQGLLRRARGAIV